MVRALVDELRVLHARLSRALARLEGCTCKAAKELRAEIIEAQGELDGVIRGYYRITPDGMEELMHYVEDLIIDTEGVLRACGCRDSYS